MGQAQSEALIKGEQKVYVLFFLFLYPLLVEWKRYTEFEEENVTGKTQKVSLSLYIRSL